MGAYKAENPYLRRLLWRRAVRMRARSSGGADRLGQIIIRAEVERTYLFLFLRAGGEDDDRDAGPGADLADDLHAVHVWKPQVEGESDPGTGT